MKAGVSIYPNFLTKKEITTKLDEIKINDIDLVFTSIQLDTLNFEVENTGWKIFTFFFEECKRRNILVSVDVSGESIKKFGIKKLSNLENVKKLGIHSLRADGGFSFEEIIELSTNKVNIKIEINASMTHDLYTLLSSIKQKGNINNIIAAHNFFPREFTGLGYDRVIEYNNIIKEFNIEISGFVTTPNSKGKLCSTSKGVPTIEVHRYRQLKFQIEDLKVLGFDYAIISEDDYTFEDLKVLKESIKDPTISLYVRNLNYENILNVKFFLRADQPEFIRRFLPRLFDIVDDYKLEKANNVKISKYDITIDNSLNGRYAGEVQVSLADFKKQDYINVIGKLCEEQEYIIESSLLLDKKIIFKKHK